MLRISTYKVRGRRMLTATVVLLTIIAGTGIAAASGVVSLPFSVDGNTINGCYSSGAN